VTISDRQLCGYATDTRVCRPGYYAENLLLAFVRRSQDMDGLAAGAARAGAQSVSWQQSSGYTNPDSWYEEARERALASARAKAEQYAAALGVKLGPVVDVSSTRTLLPGTRFGYNFGSVPDQPDADTGRPLEPDGHLAQASVYVTYAIE
jgi:uncharacterized protein